VSPTLVRERGAYQAFGIADRAGKTRCLKQCFAERRDAGSLFGFAALDQQLCAFGVGRIGPSGVQGEGCVVPLTGLIGREPLDRVVTGEDRIPERLVYLGGAGTDLRSFCCFRGSFG